jgi:hypothetical protein
MMRIVATFTFFLLCCAAFTAGLPRLHRHHLQNTNTTTTTDPERDAQRVASFFKLAHSRVTVDSDLKTTAVGLAPLFVELCASVPSCEADFMDLLADRQSELRLASDRMYRLYLTFDRVRRIVHGEGGGKKRHPAHRALKRKGVGRRQEV